MSVKPRNPLPARGGTAPEPIALEAKLLAPFAFRSRRERAITAEDYAELAQRNVRRSSARPASCAGRAAGTKRASRSIRRTARRPDRRLLREIRRYLYRYRRMGHDLAVAPAQYVPLEVALEVCVVPDYTRGAGQGRAARRFRATAGSRTARSGFFHPDQLTFWQGIYVSQIIAAAKPPSTGWRPSRVATLERLDGDRR